ncbi:hypothetical protein PVAP13_9NG653501, partial [Panicum virgatum]
GTNRAIDRRLPLKALPLRPQVHLSVSLLKPFPALEGKLSPDLLPYSSSSFPGGDDWASGGPTLCRRRAHPPGEPSSFFLVIMDPKHSAEVSKHLDKQNQALMETYRAMSHELHKLQVEEETIMRKLYELMSAEGLLPKRKKEKQQEEKAVESILENKE